jgi:cell division protein FtsB
LAGSKNELLPIHLPGPRDEAGEEGEGRRGWLSNVYLIVVVVFSICLVKLYIDQYIEIRRLGREVEVARVVYEKTRKEQERLTEEVEYLETLEGVERLARDKLRYIRPDEVMLRFTSPTYSGEVSGATGNL